MTEERLEGGNTHAAIVRVGDTVRRPTGPWTPSVHALLRHLERSGFGGAPRVHGIDDQGREILDYVEGVVVHPDHDVLVLGDDSALVEIAGKKLKAKAESTGGWEKFDPHAIGTVKIDKAGPVTLAVRPAATPKGNALMNLQSVTLKRTGA